jgi:2-polyprenyl-3-methyl-5-hydroxy-6-metoxy-1,4-benzoquinol methylase
MHTEPQYYSYSRKEMLEFVPDNVTRSLEVGCGIGNFSSFLKKRNIETWGIEPDYISYLELVRKRNVDIAINLTFEQFYESTPNEKFDLIIFNDILEHTVDPWNILKNTKHLLSESGNVIISIPNFLYFHNFFEFLFTKDFKYTKSGVFDKTHLRFFTKRSLTRMIYEVNMRIEIIKGLHPTDSIKFKLFNILTLGYYQEMKFLQYGVRARFTQN